MDGAARDEEPVQLAQGSAPLLPNECLLRGGFLKEPLIFPRVSQVAGKGFIPLWKTDPLLNRFLTPGSVNGRPLADCRVFGRILEARNLAQEAASASAEAAVDAAVAAAAQDIDPVAVLGLDKKPTKKRKRKLGGNLPRDFLPPFVGITVDTLARQEPWVLVVATASHRGACPAIEATAHNLQRLFEEVRHQLCEVATAQLACGHGREPQQPRRQAQGPPNNREYLHTLKGKNGPKKVWRKRARTNEKLARPYSYRYKVSTRPAEVGQGDGEPDGQEDGDAQASDSDPYA